MSLALDLATALDPARHMQAAGLIPDDWQRDFLRSTAPRSLLLCARQTGKSSTIAALASHVAVYEPGSLVLLAAPSQQQSRELYRKVRSFHGDAAEDAPEAESIQRLELRNGSRIVSVSGNPITVRGFSGPRLIVLDEAAFVEDELFHAVTPMLAAGGRLIAMTTPNGRRGWFYDAWTGNDPSWHRTRITAAESPRLTPAFLATERASKPLWRYRQEYEVAFVDNEMTLFPSDVIEAAMTPAVRPLFPVSPFARLSGGTSLAA